MLKKSIVFLFLTILLSVGSVPVFCAGDTNVSQVYAYPVPFKASEHTEITFAFLPNQGNIRIYSTAGEIVQRIDFQDPVDGKLEWNVTNSAGEKLGTDVFLYIVESGGNRKIGKFVVIR